MKKKSNIKINPFLITALLYLVSIIIIAPWGEFSVNDDWAYARQVEAFKQGNFKISSFITASFIAQAVIGHIGVFILGYSLTTLRVLTILNTLLILLGAYKLLKFQKTSYPITLTTLLLIVFNPLVYHSSMTFMSDNYFLTFLIWNIYYMFKYYENDKLPDLAVAAAFCALAVLVRQIGIVPYVAFLMILVKNRSSAKKAIQAFLVYTGLISLSLLIINIWPRYPFGNYYNNWKEFTDMAPTILFSLWYFTFFSAPLFISNWNALTKKVIAMLMVLTVLLAYIIFKHDVFPVGNVLYLEGLFVKSDFRSVFSIFDNIPIKIVMALLISYSTTYFLYRLIESRKGASEKLKNDRVTQFLLLTTLGLFFIIFLGNDFYDRHLIPPLITFTLLIVRVFNVQKIKGFSIGMLSVILLISILLQNDFIQTSKLSWKQAGWLVQESPTRLSINVDSVYSKYHGSSTNGDISAQVAGVATTNVECYTQRYALDSYSWFNKTVGKLNEGLTSRVRNPVAYDAKQKTKIPRIKEHLDEVIYSEEYFSPQFNLVGKRTYVGTICMQDTDETAEGEN